MIFDNDNEDDKAKSNQNIATCFGIALNDVLNGVDKFKILKSTTTPITDLIVLETNFEVSLKKDLESKGHQGLYEALETDARNLIKPISNNHQKGSIARLIARGIQDNIEGDYVPEFVVELCELIATKIELK